MPIDSKHNIFSVYFLARIALKYTEFHSWSRLFSHLTNTIAVVAFTVLEHMMSVFFNVFIQTLLLWRT